MNHIHKFISIVQTYDCIVYQISCSKRKHVILGTSDIIIKLILSPKKYKITQDPDM